MIRIVNEQLNCDNLVSSDKLSDKPYRGKMWITKSGKFIKVTDLHEDAFDDISDKLGNYNYWDFLDMSGWVRARIVPGWSHSADGNDSYIQIGENTCFTPDQIYAIQDCLEELVCTKGNDIVIERKGKAAQTFNVYDDDDIKCVMKFVRELNRL